MEERIPRKSVEVSNEFKVSRTKIYDFTYNTFGFLQAERYTQQISKSLDTLFHYYPYYPECRYLQTKRRMYRNIILDAHLIIYRIMDERVEVLDIIHSASSIRKIQEIRKVRL